MGPRFFASSYVGASLLHEAVMMAGYRGWHGARPSTAANGERPHCPRPPGCVARPHLPHHPHDRARRRGPGGHPRLLREQSLARPPRHDARQCIRRCIGGGLANVEPAPHNHIAIVDVDLEPGRFHTVDDPIVVTRTAGDLAGQDAGTGTGRHRGQLRPMVVTLPNPQTIFHTSALGTRADLLVTDPDALVAAARILQDELERIDGLASRFRSDSEISRLHDANGHPTVVSDGLLEAVLVALRVAEATDGAVDPTVGGAMCDLGYDRDFSEIACGLPGRLPRARAIPGWRAVEIDVEARTVRLPRGARLDLGATAKALAADRIATAVHWAHGCGVLVSLGGDVATAGAPTEGFRVGLGDACGMPNGHESVAIFSGGLATSGIGVRQWQLGRHRVHHIVDPSTGLPVRPVWRTVTVCAASCVDANAASTAAMVKGAAAGRWLESHRLPARLVAVDGTVVSVGGWPDEHPGAVDPKAAHR